MKIESAYILMVVVFIGIITILACSLHTFKQTQTEVKNLNIQVKALEINISNLVGFANQASTFLNMTDKAFEGLHQRVLKIENRLNNTNNVVGTNVVGRNNVSVK